MEAKSKIWRVTLSLLTPTIFFLLVIELIDAFKIFTQAFVITKGGPFKATYGRALPLNVDGALAALSSDMGFDPLMAKGLFVLARTAGLLAHVQEETAQGKPMKFTPRAAVRYTGPVRTIADTAQ